MGLQRLDFFPRVLALIAITTIVICTSSCEGGEGAEGVASEGPAAAEAATSEGSNSAASEALEASEAVEPAHDAAADEALRAAEDTSSNAHFYIRIDEEGVVNAIDELGFKSEPVARLDETGRLWEVNSAGQPIRAIAIIRNGQLSELNSFGQAGNVIGQLRATISGSAAIEVYPNTSTELNVIGRLRPGDVLEILDSQPDWLRIRMPDGDDGWIQAGLAFNARVPDTFNDRSDRKSDNRNDGVPNDWNQPSSPDERSKPGERSDSAPKDWNRPSSPDIFGQRQK